MCRLWRRYFLGDYTLRQADAGLGGDRRITLRRLSDGEGIQEGEEEMTRIHTTVSGTALRKCAGTLTENVEVSNTHQLFFSVRWDSTTERRWFFEAKNMLVCIPKLLNVVIWKPPSILLGDTAKAPRYYPDALIQDMSGKWWIVEIKGKVVTATWNKVRRIIEDRIESGKLSIVVEGYTNIEVQPGLLVVTWIDKQWHYDYTAPVAAR